MSNSEFDASSVAPSANPSNYPGKKKEQAEIIVPNNPQIKSITDSQTLNLEEPRFKKLFPMGESIKHSMNCFKSKKSPIQEIMDAKPLFDFKDIHD